LEPWRWSRRAASGALRTEWARRGDVGVAGFGLGNFECCGSWISGSGVLELE
jgi:hypothetical protein